MEVSLRLSGNCGSGKKLLEKVLTDGLAGNGSVLRTKLFEESE
jgi:hypothetical protein